MKIGIALFAYCRSEHLKRVLEGLEKNKGIEELYIFQDGLKGINHKAQWEETRAIIQDVTWCKTHVFCSVVNKGLRRSIIEGVNKVLEENEAVIVLEDDCVPAPEFTNFMNQCFEKYKDYKEVYSVSGYNYPMSLPKSEYDIYFCGRISSWGWGTWKDRWAMYEEDYAILRRLNAERGSSVNLATWGKDLERMLIDKVKGMNDSWAVFWALKMIENGGMCIYPYDSLIENIGTDGTGTHCGVTEQFKVHVKEISKNCFNLPNNVEILDSTKEAFAKLYGSYTAINNEKVDREKVLIYGIGGFYFRNEKVINDTYDIMAFIDQGKTGWFAGKKILKCNEIINYKYEKIIIMLQDLKECINIVKLLIEVYKIPCEKIILGAEIYGDYRDVLECLDVLPDGKIVLKNRD